MTASGGASGAQSCAGCGHERALHEHYRAGSDCAERDCSCPKFTQPSVVVRLARRVTQRTRGR